jgi:hypothetical protein
MQTAPDDQLQFLDLPSEIRLQVYEDAIRNEPEILACSCASTIKTRPFIGDCTAAQNLREFILDMPYPLLINKQTYNETQHLADQFKHHKPHLVVGGTKCLATLLKHLPKQYPREIGIIMRLTVRSSWSHRTSEADCTLASFDSLVSSLGIGTGKAYTVCTKEFQVLPDVVGEGLELLEIKLDLSMRSQGQGWLAFDRHGVAAQKAVAAT